MFWFCGLSPWLHISISWGSFKNDTFSAIGRPALWVRIHQGHINLDGPAGDGNVQAWPRYTVLLGLGNTVSFEMFLLPQSLCVKGLAHGWWYGYQGVLEPFLNVTSRKECKPLGVYPWEGYWDFYPPAPPPSSLSLSLSPCFLAAVKQAGPPLCASCTALSHDQRQWNQLTTGWKFWRREVSHHELFLFYVYFLDLLSQRWKANWYAMETGNCIKQHKEHKAGF